MNDDGGVGIYRRALGLGRPTWVRPGGTSQGPSSSTLRSRLRSTGDCAPVVDDAAAAVERHLAAMMRLAGLTPSTNWSASFAFAS